MQCPYCTFRNNSNAKTCKMCDKKLLKRDTTKSNAASSAFISCSVCTLLNEIDEDACRACSAPLSRDRVTSPTKSKNGKKQKTQANSSSSSSSSSSLSANTSAHKVNVKGKAAIEDDDEEEKEEGEEEEEGGGGGENDSIDEDDYYAAAREHLNTMVEKTRGSDGMTKLRCVFDNKTYTSG